MKAAITSRNCPLHLCLHLVLPGTILIIWELDLVQLVTLQVATRISALPLKTPAFQKEAPVQEEALEVTTSLKRGKRAARTS